MWDLIARYPLAPILIWQGLKLRRTALVLPEAAGPRLGETGQGPLVRVLVVGDSSAAGVGVEQQSQALSGRIAAYLAPDRRVVWQLWARTGATTRSTLAMLDRKPSERFDVAVIALGVNDVTRGVSVRRWIGQQAQLRDVLRGQFGVQHMIFTAVPPLDRFPALSPLLRWILGAQANRCNLALRDVIAAQSDCTYMVLDLDLDPTHMARDGFHPGAVIYDAWAESVAQKICDVSKDDFL